MIKAHNKTICEILGRGSVHPFPARMAPGIALNALGNDRVPLRVLDPMVGSGTVLAVARSKGHYAIGFDSDPLSVYCHAYGVDRSGNVYRLTSGSGARAGHKLRKYTNSEGFNRVKIKLDGETKARHHRVDGLVMRTFVGPFQGGETIAHLNGVNEDDTVSNLKYRPSDWDGDDWSSKYTPIQKRASRALLLEGLLDDEIADLLYVSEEAVRRHRRSLRNSFIELRAKKLYLEYKARLKRWML